MDLKYFKDTEVNISNVLIITENFSIKNSFEDYNFLYYSIYRDILFDITDFFSFELSKPFESFPTRYSDNHQDSDSFLDFVFLYQNSSEYNNHCIHPDWRLTLDYDPITVNISIIEEHVQTKKQSLIKNSEEESHFINKLVYFLKSINTESIQSIDTFETIIQTFASNIYRIWHKHSKIVNITRYSKTEWDNNCYRDLDMYKQSKQLEDWKKFKRTVKKTKQEFFNRKIDEITNKKCSPWELMN